MHHFPEDEKEKDSRQLEYRFRTFFLLKSSTPVPFSHFVSQFNPASRPLTLINTPLPNPEDGHPTPQPYVPATRSRFQPLTSPVFTFAEARFKGPRSAPIPNSASIFKQKIYRLSNTRSSLRKRLHSAISKEIIMPLHEDSGVKVTLYPTPSTRTRILKEIRAAPKP